MNMQANKYFWLNDYLDQDINVEDHIYNRDILLLPTKSDYEAYQFHESTLGPIIEVIQQHIEAGNKIAICGDYDVDGITATAILLQTLAQFSATVVYYIPNRFTDGYGINTDIVTKFHDDDVKLIITVDNGIVAYEAVKHALALDMDIIVTDHHGIGDASLATPYVLHPQLDVNLKDAEICGAMVAFLLARDLLTKAGFNDENFEQALLQLATLGTIADMMPLNQTLNRAVTWLGFQSMKRQPLLIITTFNRLLAVEQFTSDTLGFQIIPCINAVGRLSDANAVVQAFLTQEVAICENNLTQFIQINQERKEITTTLMSEIETQITDEKKQEQGFLLVHGKNWHQGILGIVAQRLMQKWSRPIIILTTTEQDENIYTGSARAFGDYDVKACFDALGDLLAKSGGHQYAGGLSVAAEQLDAVNEKLGEYNTNLLAEHKVTPSMTLQVDGWLPLQKVNADFLQYQEKFAPFGEANKKFNIGIQNVRIQDIQELGKTKQHVKMTVTENNKTYQIVAFQMYELMSTIAKYSTVDLVIECQKNYFAGVERLQYLLIDIRPQAKQIFDFRNLQHQNLPVLTQTEHLSIAEIPLDVDDFFQQIASQTVKHIYLQPLKFEHQLLYADHLEKKYFDYIYKYVYTKTSLDLTDENIHAELYSRKIPKSIFLYVIRVFFELDFVIIEENICQISESVTKKELATSLSYQKLAKWLALRNLLLTSSVDTLYKELLKF